MKLYLVRHGESEANKNHIYSGFLDTKLTENGINQAKKCKELLKDITFEKVICSDLQRAYKTALIVSGANEQDLIVKEGLREMNFGKWEGLSHKEILEKDKENYDMWMEDYFNIPAPEGESLNSFYDRVSDEFDLIKTEYLFENIRSEMNILVVSHSGVIRALISKEIIGSMDGYWKFFIDNCSITVIEYDEKKFGFLKNLNYTGKI